MNELQLSDDLNVITAEINSYKQLAGQAIFEIGKRLNHVKEKDLVHGEFGNWLESMEIERSFATRSMKVANELSDSNYVTWNNLSARALYEIATLPQEEREKEHVTSKGETKTVDEMTVRELQEVKRKNKELEQLKQQAEKEAEQAKKSNERMGRLLDEAYDKEPEKIEVVPDDYDYYKGNYESAVSLQKRYKEQVEEMKEELNSVHDELKKERYKITDDEAEEKEKQVKIMMLDASKSVLQTKLDIDEFMQKVAVTSYRRGAIAASSESTKKKIREGIDDLKNFISEMEMALDGTIEQDY